MKRFILLAILVHFFLNNNAFSQQKAYPVRIYGIILSADSLKPLPFVNVSGTKHGVAISDKKGRFSIITEKTDTLLFSSIGFRQYSFCLRDSTIHNNEHQVRILLSPTNYLLNPVIILNKQPSRSLAQDLIHLQLPKEKDTSFTIKGVSPPPKIISSKIIIKRPVSAFYDKYSKEAKEKKKLAHWKKGDVFRVYLDSLINSSMVIAMLHIREEDLKEFTRYCLTKEELMKKNNYYELLEEIKKQYVLFIRDASMN